MRYLLNRLARKKDRRSNRCRLVTEEVVNANGFGAHDRVRQSTVPMPQGDVCGDRFNAEDHQLAAARIGGAEVANISHFQRIAIAVKRETRNDLPSRWP